MKSVLIFAAIAGLLLTGCSKHVQQRPRDFIGVGLMLRQSQGRPLIIMDVVSNSPAAKAGLTQGMVVEKIDGTPTDGMNLRQMVDRIRGPEGSTVTLEVVDSKNDTTNSVTLTRVKIAIPPAPMHP